MKHVRMITVHEAPARAVGIIGFWIDSIHASLHAWKGVGDNRIDLDDVNESIC